MRDKALQYFSACLLVERILLTTAPSLSNELITKQANFTENALRFRSNFFLTFEGAVVNPYNNAVICSFTTLTAFMLYSTLLSLVLFVLHTALIKSAAISDISLMRQDASLVSHLHFLRIDHPIQTKLLYPSLPRSSRHCLLSTKQPAALSLSLAFTPSFASLPQVGGKHCHSAVSQLASR